MSTASQVQLKNRNLTVGIAPESGGALTSWSVRRGKEIIEILRTPQSLTEHVPRSTETSYFPLVPYCGRLRAGRFRFENRTYQFPLNVPSEKHSVHGNGWMKPWAIVERTAESIVIELNPDPSIPIAYRCRQHISLSDRSLHLSLTITNTGAERAPVGIGFHPYFANRAGATIRAALPTRWILDDELMPVCAVANADRYTFLNGISVDKLSPVEEYEGWDGHAVIEWLSQRMRLTLETVPSLTHAVTWCPAGQDFFCFEPQSHRTDVMNDANILVHGTDLIVLDPGESAERRLDLYLSDC